MNFTVLDIKTGKYPDLSDIALHEEWAQDLMYCDMDGFAVQEDGTLILMDECGRFAYCPEGRFQIVLDKPNEWERAGLYGKYTVYKNKDGSLVTDCFILRPAKDPAAVAALRAYAATTDNAELAADIINWVGAEPNEPLSCEGCYWQNHGTIWKCATCARGKTDNYRRPPGGDAYD